MALKKLKFFRCQNLSPRSNFIIHITSIKLTSELFRIARLSKKITVIELLPLKITFFSSFLRMFIFGLFIVRAIFKVIVKMDEMLLFSTTITSELFIYVFSFGEVNGRTKLFFKFMSNLPLSYRRGGKLYPQNVL